MSSDIMWFEKLVEAVPDALVGMDQNGVIRFVNRQTELLFGYDRDQLIGETVATLVPETLWQIYTQHREGYFADPRTRSSGLDLELSGRHHDGGMFPINISLSNIDTGDALLVITAAGDVAQHQRVVRNVGLTMAVVESADDAIIGSTMAGTITSWNPAAERMYGYSSNEVIGRYVSDLLAPADRADEAGAVLAKIRAGRHVEHLETERVRKDGTMFPVSITVAPIRGADGEVVGASAVHRDVTEQRRAFETAQRMAAIVESSEDAIIGETLEGVITSWNPSAVRMFGYSCAEIIGKSVGLLTPEDRKAEIRDVLARVGAGQHVENFETMRVRKDGTMFPASVTLSPICDAEGVIVGASVIAHDVTEQKEAFEATQRLASIVENSQDAIISGSLDGNVASWNPAAERLYGYSSEEVIGKPAVLLAPKDRAGEVQAIREKVKAGQHVKEFETMRVRKDGTVFPISLTVSRVRDVDGVVVGTSVIHRDLTAQKRAEQAVARDRDLLRATMDSLMDPHVLLEAVRDEAGKIVDFVYVDANPAACAYNGMDHQHLVGARLLDLQPGNIGSGLFDRYVRVVETGEPLVLDDIVYAQELLGGQERHYDVRAARVGDGLSYTWRDVTDRHAAAQWLAESEEHYRLLAENASDVVMRLSPDRRFEWVSGSVADVLGWPAPDLLGHVIDEFIHPEELAPFRHAIVDANAEKTASTEFRFRRSDGSYRWVLGHTRLKVDEDGAPEALVGGLIDIEARKAVEAQEMDRLETLERFQRLTLGRELKMIELKKEIESLRRLVHKDGDDGDKH